MVDKIKGESTLVTENKIYHITSLGRKGLTRATVSARSHNIDSTDVLVTRTKPHIIQKHSNKFLQISTTFPVIAHFIPGTPEDETPTEPTPPTYTTGIIYVDEDIRIGDMLTISVLDPDIRTNTMQVTVFNKTTGETETLELNRLTNGMFRGEIPVKPNPYKGIDFDGVMNARDGETLLVMYTDARGSSDAPEYVQKEVSCFDDYVEPVLRVRARVAPEGTMGIAVLGGKQPHSIRAANMRTEESILIPLHVDSNDEDMLVGQFQPNERFVDLEEGDTLQLTYAYADNYGVQQAMHHLAQISSSHYVGRIEANDYAVYGSMLEISLDDPDVITSYVDVTVAGDTSGAFDRVRLLPVAPFVGVYRASTQISQKFSQDTSLTITYADNSDSGTQMVRKSVELLPDTTPPVEPPVVTPPSEEHQAQQLSMQIEINGLFTLNGRFSGVIHLYAKEDESVHCSILQAS